MHDRVTGLVWLREVPGENDGANLGKARGAANKLKEQKFAGCSDWRLPWEEELKSLIEYAKERGYSGKKSKGYPADYFNRIGFNSVVNNYYWTESLDVALGMPHAGRIAVDLEDGVAVRKPVDNAYTYYWPVCKPD